MISERCVVPVFFLFHLPLPPSLFPLSFLSPPVQPSLCCKVSDDGDEKANNGESEGNIGDDFQRKSHFWGEGVDCLGEGEREREKKGLRGKEGEREGEREEEKGVRVRGRIEV